MRGLEVEQLCFGTVPPRVQAALSLYDPEKRVLWISFDVEFQTSGFQSVVRFFASVCLCCCTRGRRRNSARRRRRPLLCFLAARALRPSPSPSSSSPPSPTIITNHHHHQSLPPPTPQILLRMKAMGPLQAFDMRVELCQVTLKGRLRFGLQLGREPPGIS